MNLLGFCLLVACFCCGSMVSSSRNNSRSIQRLKLQEAYRQLSVVKQRLQVGLHTIFFSPPFFILGIILIDLSSHVALQHSDKLLRTPPKNIEVKPSSRHHSCWLIFDFFFLLRAVRLIAALPLSAVGVHQMTSKSTKCFRVSASQSATKKQKTTGPWKGTNKNENEKMSTLLVDRTLRVLFRVGGKSNQNFASKVEGMQRNRSDHDFSFNF